MFRSDEIGCAVESWKWVVSMEQDGEGIHYAERSCTGDSPLVGHLQRVGTQVFARLAVSGNFGTVKQ
jgi:hypothetical protein